MDMPDAFANADDRNRLRPDIASHEQMNADEETAQPTGSAEPLLHEHLEWFQDQKLGFMMHFGPYSQWGCIESWPLVEADTWARPDDLKPWIERGRDLPRFQRDYWALSRDVQSHQL